jgi:hypothetical protein
MRALKAFPVSIFMALLCLPPVARIVGHPKVPQLQEYRVLAVRPHISTLLGHKIDFLEYTKRLDAWYSDNFATRPFWVRLHTQVLYSMFQESDQVYIGKRGWLYYHSVLDRETPPLDDKTTADRKAIRDDFARLSTLLKSRGIALFVMPLALKSRYYPEFLPSSAEHARHFKFYDAYMDEAAADGRFNLIDTRPILEAAKRGGMQIWHKTDFHWTDPAGGLATRPLVQALAIADHKPALAPSWAWDVTVDPKLSGGQGRALPLFQAPTEVAQGVAPKTPNTDFVYAPPNAGGIEFAGVAKPGQGERLSPVFVFGDSYFDAPGRAGFFSLFQAFARARLYSNDLVEAFGHRQPGTRFMVLEYITSSTDGMDNSIKKLMAEMETNPDL